ncbi:MAG TPA: hypothetical protein ENG60_00200 [Thermoplasmatales archaeon]|nr:hypothetical protein [Thermoplasmatales archaeon]HEX16829.1 hypothetical protein [Thermoplasmatales archaeon]
MGCVIDGDLITNVKLDYIQDFEMMFARMGIERPRESAVYYTILVIDNPKEFSDFLRISERLANITRRPLEAGRSCLFKNGLIAKVLFSSESKDDLFGRERYLPVNPRVIWEETRRELKPIISEDTYRNMEKHIMEVVDFYNRNFKAYGIKLMRNGNVTLRYNKMWAFYTMLNNTLEREGDLKIHIGDENISEECTLKYLRRFLELSKKVRMIVEREDNLQTLIRLKEEYNEKLEARYLPNEVTGLMRNFLFGNELAITSMKILSERDTPYIGTAYVDLEDIDELNEKFENLWNLGRPI